MTSMVFTGLIFRVKPWAGKKRIRWHHRFYRAGREQHGATGKGWRGVARFARALVGAFTSVGTVCSRLLLYTFQSHHRHQHPRPLPPSLTLSHVMFAASSSTEGTNGSPPTTSAGTRRSLVTGHNRAPTALHSASVNNSTLALRPGRVLFEVRDRRHGRFNLSVCGPRPCLFSRTSNGCPITSL